MNVEPAEPAQWNGYREGAGGKIWYSPDGSHYARILADVGDNLVNPMFVELRVIFLSDHEGLGALYPALPDGTDLRRHRPRRALRPARDDRRPARGLPASRGDLDARVARRRADAPGHTTRRRRLGAYPLVLRV
jgi:hypothetical protein